MEKETQQILTSSSLPSEPNAVNKKKSIVELVKEKAWLFSPTSEERILVRFSGHHLKWSWSKEGTTARVPIKAVYMRNWKEPKKIYTFNGATVVLNPNTLEIWTKSKPYKNVQRMIYANWNKADLIAREFSTFAGIALKPVKTNHPADIVKAHLVLTTKALNPILKPMSEIKDEVGLIFDKSHPHQPELTGEKAVEGAYGAEWFFTKFPKVVQYQIEMDARYAKNLELHLSVLQEIRDAIKQLKEAKKP